MIGGNKRTLQELAAMDLFGAKATMFITSLFDNISHICKKKN